MGVEDPSPPFDDEPETETISNASRASRARFLRDDRERSVGVDTSSARSAALRTSWIPPVSCESVRTRAALPFLPACRPMISRSSWTEHSQSCDQITTRDARVLVRSGSKEIDWIGVNCVRSAALSVAS